MSFIMYLGILTMAGMQLVALWLLIQLPEIFKNEQGQYRTLPLWERVSIVLTIVITTIVAYFHIIDTVRNGTALLG